MNLLAHVTVLWTGLMVISLLAALAFIFTIAFVFLREHPSAVIVVGAVLSGSYVVGWLVLELAGWFARG